MEEQTTPQYKFMFIGFGKQGQKDFKAQLISFLFNLGGTYIENEKYQDSCTHFICIQPWPCGIQKFLGACATGKWVLTPEYIEESHKSGRWLAERDFEWGVTKKSTVVKIHSALPEWVKTAPKRNRMRKLVRHKLNAGLPFKKWVTCIAHADKVKRLACEEILKHGGARIKNITSYDDDQAYRGTTHIFSERIGINLPYLTKLEEIEVKCLHIDFIRDFILKNEKPREEDYYIDKYSLDLLRAPSSESLKALKYDFRSLKLRIERGKVERYFRQMKQRAKTVNVTPKQEMAVKTLESSSSPSKPKERKYKRIKSIDSESNEAVSIDTADISKESNTNEVDTTPKGLLESVSKPLKQRNTAEKNAVRHKTSFEDIVEVSEESTTPEKSNLDLLIESVIQNTAEISEESITLNKPATVRRKKKIIENTGEISEEINTAEKPARIRRRKTSAGSTAEVSEESNTAEKPATIRRKKTAIENTGEISEEINTAEKPARIRKKISVENSAEISEESNTGEKPARIRKKISVENTAEISEKSNITEKSATMHRKKTVVVNTSQSPAQRRSRRTSVESLNSDSSSIAETSGITKAGPLRSRRLSSLIEQTIDETPETTKPVKSTQNKPKKRRSKEDTKEISPRKKIRKRSTKNKGSDVDDDVNEPTKGEILKRLYSTPKRNLIKVVEPLKNDESPIVKEETIKNESLDLVSKETSIKDDSVMYKTADSTLNEKTMYKTAAESSYERSFKLNVLDENTMDESVTKDELSESAATNIDVVLKLDKPKPKRVYKRSEYTKPRRKKKDHTKSQRYNRKTPEKNQSEVEASELQDESQLGDEKSILEGSTAYEQSEDVEESTKDDSVLTEEKSNTVRSVLTEENSTRDDTVPTGESSSKDFSVLTERTSKDGSALIEESTKDKSVLIEESTKDKSVLIEESTIDTSVLTEESATKSKISPKPNEGTKSKRVRKKVDKPVKGTKTVLKKRITSKAKSEKLIITEDESKVANQQDIDKTDTNIDSTKAKSVLSGEKVRQAKKVLSEDTTKVKTVLRKKVIKVKRVPKEILKAKTKPEESATEPKESAKPEPEITKAKSVCIEDDSKAKNIHSEESTEAGNITKVKIFRRKVKRLSKEKTNVVPKEFTETKIVYKEEISKANDVPKEESTETKDVRMAKIMETIKIVSEEEISKTKDVPEEESTETKDVRMAKIMETIKIVSEEQISKTKDVPEEESTETKDVRKEKIIEEITETKIVPIEVETKEQITKSTKIEPKEQITKAKSLPVPMKEITKAEMLPVPKEEITKAKSLPVPKEEITKAKSLPVPKEEITKAKSLPVPKEEITKTKTKLVPKEEITKTKLVPKEEIAKTKLVPKEEIAKTKLVPKEEIAKTKLVPKEEIAKTKLVPKEEVDKTKLVPKEEIAKTKLVPKEEIAKTKLVPKEEIAKTKLVPKEEIAKTKLVPKEEIAKTKLVPKEIIKTKSLPKEEITKTKTVRSDEITEAKVTGGTARTEDVPNYESTKANNEKTSQLEDKIHSKKLKGNCDFTATVPEIERQDRDESKREAEEMGKTEQDYEDFDESDDFVPCDGNLEDFEVLDDIDDYSDNELEPLSDVEEPYDKLEPLFEKHEEIQPDDESHEDMEKADDEIKSKSKNAEDEIIEELEPDDKIQEELEPEDKILEELEPEDKILEELEPEDKILEGLEPEDKILEGLEPEDKILEELELEDEILEELEPEDKILEGLEPEDKIPEELEPEYKILEELEPEDKILEELEPEDKILEELEPEDKILEKFEPEDKILEELEPEDKILEELEPEDKILEKLEPEDKILEELELKDKILEELEPEYKILEELEPEDKILEELEPEDEILEELEPEDKILEELESNETLDEMEGDRDVDKIEPDVVLDKIEPDHNLDEIEPADEIQGEIEPAEEIRDEIEPADEIQDEIEPADEIQDEIKPADEIQDETKVADEIEHKNKQPNEIHPKSAYQIKPVDEIQDKTNLDDEMQDKNQDKIQLEDKNYGEIVLDIKKPTVKILEINLDDECYDVDDQNFDINLKHDEIQRLGKVDERNDDEKMDSSTNSGEKRSHESDDEIEDDGSHRHKRLKDDDSYESKAYEDDSLEKSLSSLKDTSFLSDEVEQPINDALLNLDDDIESPQAELECENDDPIVECVKKTFQQEFLWDTEFHKMNKMNYFTPQGHLEMEMPNSITELFNSVIDEYKLEHAINFFISVLPHGWYPHPKVLNKIIQFLILNPDDTNSTDKASSLFNTISCNQPALTPSLSDAYIKALCPFPNGFSKSPWNTLAEIISSCILNQINCHILFKFYIDVFEQDFEAFLRRSTDPAGDFKMKRVTCPVLTQIFWSSNTVGDVTNPLEELFAFVYQSIIQTDSNESFNYLINLLGLVAECTRLAESNSLTIGIVGTRTKELIRTIFEKCRLCELDNFKLYKFVCALKPSWLQAHLISELLTKLPFVTLSQTRMAEPLSLVKILECYLNPISRKTTEEISAGGNQMRVKSKSECQSPLKASVINRRNRRGETQVHLACLENQPEKLKRLLDVPGVDVNIRDYAGWTPLHEACNGGYVDCVSLLLKHNPGSKNVAQRLKKDPVDIMAKSNDGTTPMHDAVGNDHIEVAKCLLEKGGLALLNIKSNSGVTPLDQIKSSRMKELIKTFTEKHFDKENSPVESPITVNEIEPQPRTYEISWYLCFLRLLIRSYLRMTKLQQIERGLKTVLDFIGKDTTYDNTLDLLENCLKCMKGSKIPEKELAYYSNDLKYYEGFRYKVEKCKLAIINLASENNKRDAENEIELLLMFL